MNRHFVQCYTALLLAVFVMQGPALAQQPGSGFQPKCWALTGARLVITPEQEVESGTIVIRDGVIVAAGKDVAAPPDAVVIDAKGLTVYPGFIDAGTTVLLDLDKPVPVSDGRTIDFSQAALAATPTDARKGLTPEFHPLDGIKYDTGALEARRKAGITTLHLLPQGRLASGQGMLLSTSGLPVREAVVQQVTYAAFELTALGSNGGYPSTAMGGSAHLRQALLDARRQVLQQQLYAQQVAGVARPTEDPVLDAFISVIDQKTRLAMTAGSRDTILRALDFCAEMQLAAPLIFGGRDAYKCLDRVKATNAGVILVIDWGEEPKEEAQPENGIAGFIAKASEKTNAESLAVKLPDPVRVQREKRDLWRERILGMKTLQEQQVKFAFATDGQRDPHELRKAVRVAIQAGLPRQAALSALTRDAATLVGQGTRLGTLEPGRLAHLVVYTGPFDNADSQIRYVFVDGQKFEYNRTAKPVEATKPALALQGEWNVQIETGASPTNATLELKQKDKALSGQFRSGQGDGVVTGRVTDTGMELTVTIGAGAQALTLTLSGALEGTDKLSGTLKSGFGAPTKWTSQRKPAEPAKPDAPKNPVELSVESDPAAPMPAPLPEGELPTELDADRRARPLRTGGNVLIKGGTVLTVSGEDLPETSIMVKGGKIAAIGKDLQPEAGMAVIDATGRFVMPGIIDTHSHIMFTHGLGGVNEATRSIVPEVRVKDVVRSDDPSAYRALAGGVTMIRMLHGSANVVGGQDAVVKLKFGEPVKDQILWDAPQGVKFALGENVKAQGGRFPNTRLGVEATLNRAFLEALEYRREWQTYRMASADPAVAAKLLPPRRDLRLEALADIVDQQKFIHSHCYRADEILMLLRVASGLGVRVWSLQHVLEGYKVAPEIVQHGASCSTFSDWWAYKVEAYDATPYNAALLQQAGANVVLKSDDAELIRHLYQEAAKLLRYGNLPPNTALRAITLNSARELGLDKRLGSVEVGKDADLAIFNGHPLNAFSRCEVTLVEGEPYFVRDQMPSAMSAASKAKSHGGPLALAAPEIRTKTLAIPVAANRQYALVGATLHPVDAPDIPNGTLLITNDTISALGAGLAVPAGVTAVDATGLHVYPGLIDSGTTLGLTEIGQVQATNDTSEAGAFQPDLRAGVGVNPDSELIPVARAGGITTVRAAPNGGTISGQGSLVRLSGWTAPEMILNLEAGLQLQWPFFNPEEPVERLREFLQTGRVYHQLKKNAIDAKLPPPLSDPRFEALGPYLERQKKVFIEVEGRHSIIEALLFAQQEKLDIVLVGAADAWKVADELKKRSIPVILGPVMKSPQNQYDPFDAPYTAAARLDEAGIAFCIRSDSASNSRNLPFEAAMAVAYGLSPESALKAVTLWPAQILGIGDKTGSLTVGKQADLLITDGSPLQPSSQVKAVFIGGRPFPPESRHTRLYEKYRARLQETQSQTK